ncbi:SigB/SigF/SigG family RNA polymerase sigma factor [Paractinoplanes hotanensis]|uniref:SigB/SigF/SigG family RNA polymerase sigma factor n=1 Tax=Paractinoplanes hotanensis TaxID=2906497 RepID=A0ABT0Y4P1_9ACTN|nr:SigB/SigF/SigG family RNA polymerase sigma factor [Actinoplanes hotanensis]MCM4081010.1 SigB/SigF/SigG family RNA polymerase sigma factor [Actinoplanes hotanensis]
MPGAYGGYASGVTRPPDCSPSDLLTALSLLPLEHPSRPALRGQAIEAWLPMAVRLASRYRHYGQPIDDLVQTATVGLIKAVDRFDPNRGVVFAGFAIPTILGEIRRYFRDRAWAVRVPRRLQEMRLRISATQNELTQKLGRSPTVADIATHLGTTEEQVLEGLEGGLAYNAVSLSEPVGRDDRLELGDTLGGDDHEYELVEARAALELAMSLLDRRDRTILILHFYGNQTQAEIAGQVGISQMHVSRLIARSLRQLRHAIDPGNGCAGRRNRSILTEV